MSILKKKDGVKSIPSRRKASYFPEKPGVQVRCPYCKEVFEWPPKKLKCPKCKMTVRPPYGYSTSDRAESLKKIEEILEDGEKRRREMGLKFNTKPKMSPAIPVAVLLVLSLLGIALSVSSSNKGRPSAVAKPKSDPLVVTTNRMDVLAMGLRHFYEDTGHYPEYYGEGGLQALIVNPGIFHWYGPYVNTILSRDGWKRPFHYDTTNGVPRLISAGPDRKFDTEDDILMPQSGYRVHPDFIRRNKARRQSASQGR